MVDNIANYPNGRRSLDEARGRAEAAGQWFEECRALLNHAWAAAESRDLTVALDYAQRGIASAERHELPILEGYVSALYARALEMAGRWHEAADIARGLLDAASITQMVALPVIGTIDLRRGRPAADTLLTQAWEMAAATGEVQRTSPAALAVAEHAWLTSAPLVERDELVRAMQDALELGFSWSPGAIAVWLWRCGWIDAAPAGIAEPYRASIEGRAHDAAATWERLGIPYERALALSDGDVADQLEALEQFETMGATAVAAMMRKSLRGRGIVVPRGKGQATRRNVAGLTARQAEVLRLLSRGMSNIQIADALFVSPRTVEHHVAAVLDKLDVSTRLEARARAESEGLLAEPA
jgi:DNA-binding CsgD family transcriptional regulator